MLNLNPDTLALVIQSALLAAAAHPRWVRAITKAGEELLSNPWIEIQGSHLLIASESGQTYDVNGVCQCSAFQHGQACWHRAARQLVARYEEAQHISVQAKAAYAAANGPRKPLFADRDAGRHALGEERAVLEEQRRKRQIAAARAAELVNELFA